MMFNKYILLIVLIIVICYFNYIEHFTTTVYTETPSTSTGLYDIICQEYRNSCPDGQELTGGTIISDKTCTECRSGYYKDSDGGEACQLHSDITSCPAGQELIDGTIISDKTCTECQSGYYKDSDGGGPCQPHKTSCGPGEELTGGSTISDKTCTECQSGHYKDSDGGEPCQPHKTSCPAGEDLTGEGTATSDFTCELCPERKYKPDGYDFCIPCLCAKVVNDLRTECNWDSTNFYTSDKNCLKFSSDFPNLPDRSHLRKVKKIYIPSGKSIAIYDDSNYSGNCVSMNATTEGFRWTVPGTHKNKIKSIKINETC